LELGIGHGLDLQHAMLVEQQQRTYGYKAAESGDASHSTSEFPNRKPAKIVRRAAGEQWEDPTLADWPDNDYRIFVGNLGNEVTNEMLLAAFKEYASASKSRVIMNKQTGKGKGYGFVSFMDPL